VTVSVCTFAGGRDTQLPDLVRGLRRSSRPPRELIVAVMQDIRYDLPCTGFPIRQVVLGSSVSSAAKARNAAAAKARGDLLVFLDSNCIPHPRLIEDYAANAKLGGLLMGEVGYLPQDACANGIDFACLDAACVRQYHEPTSPAQAAAACRDLQCFTVANFAVTARDFATMRGFDERYVGPGGEEIDFARTAASVGLPLWWLQGARAYHQFQGAHVPPVDQLDAVLRNVRMFERKWGEPAMQDWLRAFERMNLIERTESGWRKLRDAGAQHLALTEQRPDQAYVSMASMLEMLEERATKREAESSASGPLRAA